MNESNEDRFMEIWRGLTPGDVSDLAALVDGRDLTHGIARSLIKWARATGRLASPPTLGRSTTTSTDIIMARRIESTGNVVSGLNEHGLANELWALARNLRKRAGLRDQNLPS